MTQRDAISDTPLLTASADVSSRAPGGTSAHRAATRLAWALWALTLLLRPDGTPFTGFVACTPKKTPVLGRSVDCRSISVS
jgi:hypothetical protein